MSRGVVRFVITEIPLQKLDSSLSGFAIKNTKLQIYIAMIAFCLTLLLKTKLGYTGTIFDFFEWISDLSSKKTCIVGESIQGRATATES